MPSMFRTCAFWMDWNVVLQYFKNISMLIILSSNAKFLFSTKYIEAVSFLKCWSFILGFFFSVSILNKAVAVLQWLNTPWQNLLCKMYTKVSHFSFSFAFERFYFRKGHRHNKKQRHQHQKILFDQIII